MPTVKKLKELKDQGYEVTDRELRLATRKDRKANRPEPPKPDPLAVMTKQLVEMAGRSDATMELVLKTLGEMLKSLSGMKPPVVNMPDPKLKKWTFRSVRIDHKTIDTTATQIK